MHGRIPPNPTDLCMLYLFKRFLTQSSSTEVKSLELQTFPLISMAWDSWKQILPVKTKASNLVLWYE